MSQNIWAIVFGFVSFIISYLSWEELGITCTCAKVFVLLGLIICIVLISAFIVLISNSETLWKRGQARITVKYGDILKATKMPNFCWCSPKEKIIVIPVNSNFDTIVEDASIPNPLVSSKTIHGKWLLAYRKDMGKTSQEIQTDIFNFLDAKKVEYERVERSKGSRRKYPLGTCAIIPGTNRTSYILIALSNFNCENAAISSRENIISSLVKLIDFINTQSQGVECYIPLLGTGLSRVHLSHKASLHTMLATLDLYQDKLVCPMTVVIYKKDKSMVSIFDR